MTDVGPPHHTAHVLRHGPAPGTGKRALIAVHGRGATAESIASLAPLLGASDAVLLAPQASAQTWYPHSFLSPIPENEPGISSAIALLAKLVTELESEGIPASRIALVGFSQGACLALEFAARHATRYGAVIGFSGGLIGPAGTPRPYRGTLDATPVFLGCSDTDAHIPAARVRETADVLRFMGGVVDMRLYPGMPHTINDDEISAAAALMRLV